MPCSGLPGSQERSWQKFPDCELRIPHRGGFRRIRPARGAGRQPRRSQNNFLPACSGHPRPIYSGRLGIPKRGGFESCLSERRSLPRLASSPVSLVALAGPRVPVGDVNLHVTVAGTDAGQFPVSAVLLEFSGPAEAVNRRLNREAHSACAWHKRAAPPGSSQWIAGGDPTLERETCRALRRPAAKRISRRVEVKFVTGGNYSVSARLISADASQPDLESARRSLTEARKIASGEWPARIDQVLQKFDQEPRNLPQIRAELKSMLDEKPAARSPRFWTPRGGNSTELPHSFVAQASACGFWFLLAQETHRVKPVPLPAW